MRTSQMFFPTQVVDLPARSAALLQLLGTQASLIKYRRMQSVGLVID